MAATSFIELLLGYEGSGYLCLDIMLVLMSLDLVYAIGEIFYMKCEVPP